MPVAHKYYHTKLRPTGPCQCWLSDFYTTVLRQEPASCFGIGLCRSTGKKALMLCQWNVTYFLTDQFKRWKGYFMLWTHEEELKRSPKITAKIVNLETLWQADRRNWGLKGQMGTSAASLQLKELACVAPGNSWHIPWWIRHFICISLSTKQKRNMDS